MFCYLSKYLQEFDEVYYCKLKTLLFETTSILSSNNSDNRIDGNLAIG